MLPSTMHAVVIHRHGGPEVLSYEEIPTPVPGPGEAVLRVRATSLNRLDLWARSGPPERVFPWPEETFPIISGSDCAGEIAAVGPGVDDALVGQRVDLYPSLYCGKCDQCQAGEQTRCYSYKIFGEHEPGAMAEYAVAPARNFVPLADHVSFTDAAAMPVAYTTAWRMLVTAGKLKGGDTILTLGVGGGVGSAALVLGRRLGARVLAGASSQAKRDLAVEHGADAAVDVREAFSERVLDLTNGRGVDIVADPLGSTWPESIRSLARGGRLVVCGATAGNRPIFDIRELYQRQRSIVGAPMGNWRDFASVMTLLNRGELRPIIDRVFPLTEIAAAHIRAESRESFGKVVVTV